MSEAFFRAVSEAVAMRLCLAEYVAVIAPVTAAVYLPFFCIQVYGCLSVAVSVILSQPVWI